MGNNSTIVIGVGTSGVNILDKLNKKVIPVDWHYAGLKPILEKEDEVKLLMSKLLQTALDYETIIIIGVLGGRSQSLLIELVETLSQSDKQYYVLVTLPMRLEGEARRGVAGRAVHTIISITPKLRLKYFDLEEWTKFILEMPLEFGIQMADDFFESEIRYILNQGSLYKVFNLDDF